MRRGGFGGLAAVLLGLAGVLLLATPGLGEHLSAGASEAVLVGPTETPETPSVEDELYRSGIAEDCREADPRANEELAMREAICGQLRYHAQAPNLTVISPEDQDLRSPGSDDRGSRQVGAFDVQVTHYVGSYGLETCHPWCSQPTVRQAYETAHIATRWAGLTEEGDERDRGTQAYGANLHLPNALQTSQGALTSTPGDGWIFPATDQGFVAHLFDGDGEAIDPLRLGQWVANRTAEGALPEDAVPLVCGFTPEAELSPRGSAPGCEVRFEWIGKGGPHGPCHAAAYICGEANQVWQAEVACGVGHGRCSLDRPDRGDRVTVERDALASRPEGTGPGDSTRDPVVWHFVVAPSPSLCEGAREPGFATTSSVAEAPYMAHDLDVYTTIDRWLAPHQATPAVDWTAGLPFPVLNETLHEATQPAWRKSASEPNEPRPVGGLNDTSRSRSIDRTWTNCERLQNPTETKHSFDPWVNVVDGRLERTRAEATWNDRRHVDFVDVQTPARAEGRIEAPTGTDGQRARTGTYTPGGHVGYFADADDSGDFERLPWSRQFDDAEQRGAYPVLWDMRLDEAGQPNAEASCEVERRGGAETQALTEAMQEAGYGAQTGIVQVVGLAEPAAWTHRLTGVTAPWPAGGVFVLASSAPLHALQAEPNASWSDEKWWLRGQAEAAIEAAAHAVGADPEEAVLLNEFAPRPPSTDYAAQCGEPTGSFTSVWQLTRDCPGDGSCRDGALVTRAMVDVEDPSQAFLEGEAWAQPFPEGHHEAFGTEAFAWTDVDRLGPRPGLAAAGSPESS